MTFLSLIFLLIGAFFMLIAAVGLVRFPDIYMRISATTKASTFGVGFSLLAAVFHFQDLGVAMRILATLAFLVLTAPIGAHAIARAAYLNGVPLWGRSVCDDLRGRYDPETEELACWVPEEK